MDGKQFIGLCYLNCNMTCLSPCILSNVRSVVLCHHHKTKNCSLHDFLSCYTLHNALSSAVLNHISFLSVCNASRNVGFSNGILVKSRHVRYVNLRGFGEVDIERECLKPSNQPTFKWYCNFSHLFFPKITLVMQFFSICISICIAMCITRSTSNISVYGTN